MVEVAHAREGRPACYPASVPATTLDNGLYQRGRRALCACDMPFWSGSLREANVRHPTYHEHMAFYKLKIVSISKAAPAAGASGADTVLQRSAAPEAAPSGATGLEPLPQASARVLERSSRPWHVLIMVRCAAMTCAAAQADLGVAPAKL